MAMPNLRVYFLLLNMILESFLKSAFVQDTLVKVPGHQKHISINFLKIKDAIYCYDHIRKKVVVGEVVNIKTFVCYPNFLKNIMIKDSDQTAILATKTQFFYLPTIGKRTSVQLTKGKILLAFNRTCAEVLDVKEIKDDYETLNKLFVIYNIEVLPFSNFFVSTVGVLAQGLMPQSLSQSSSFLSLDSSNDFFSDYSVEEIGHTSTCINRFIDTSCEYEYL